MVDCLKNCMYKKELNMNILYYVLYKFNNVINVLKC